jgi:RNA polymerase sigma factor (sigma-70 family)
MAAYIDGDMEAFEVLYGRHKNRVFGFLMARLKDRSQAEDVFQTVFGKLHRFRNKYQPQIPFLPWLFTLVRNTLIDHIRKTNASGKCVTFDQDALEANLPLVFEPATAIQAVVADFKLSESQRRALELRFNQGLTFAEIAGQMQTSADNSRQIVSRAIRKLRSLMLREGKRHEKK